LIPSLTSETQVLILQHPSETAHALNTARLAALGLSSAELVVGEIVSLPADERDNYLLFPGPEAISLETLANSEVPLRLIVPDGTWRKARKMLHLNSELAALPRVSLPTGLVSRYRLRKAPAPGAISTLEAIVAALNILEGEGRFDGLLRPFDALIEAQIAAMGLDVYQRNHGYGQNAQGQLSERAESSCEGYKC